MWCLIFQIWSAIDNQSFLYATQLFLLARHVNTGLQLDAQQAARILQWFPVLSRQWAVISHFRNTILQVSGAKVSSCGLVLTTREMCFSCV